MPKNEHSFCYKFEQDFDRKVAVCVPLGRLCAGPYVIRVVMSPKGIIFGVPQEAIDEGFVLVNPRNYELEFMAWEKANEEK